MTARATEPSAPSGPGAVRECSDPAHLTVFIDDGEEPGTWAEALSYAPYRRISDGVWTNGFVPASVDQASFHSAGVADA